MAARATTLTRSGRAATLDFRVLLDALANPGQIGTLDVPDGVPAAVLPVLSLADVEVALSVLEPETTQPTWADRVRMTTGARIVPVSQAQLLLALRPATAADILTAPRGDAYHPEAGCRLVLAVTALAESARILEPGALTMTTSGPGVPDQRSFAVTGLAAEIVDALIEANASFPTGVDTFLVDASGRVVGLPRSNRLHVEATSEGSL